MKDEAWVSFPVLESSFMPGIESDLTRSDLKHSAAIAKRYEKGEVLDPDELPKKYFGRYKDKLLKGLPDFFYANGFFAVSAKCADILRKFNLGRAQLCPVTVYQNDGATELPGTFFLIANIDHRPALDTERSKGIQRVYKGYDLFRSAPVTEDGDIVVSGALTGGSNLWVDPTLKFSLFFRAELEAALRQGGINTFKRVRCTVHSGL
ncbi:imm11 family protein [Nitratireductor soli]|uniref:imm11 family protein n=1 Tax=Nitratireductor soli TaxID=1670619 RepID=UPI00065E9627|nr:DUF1629 domain-containing protein [Nitratireductor soli]